ncbi:MAG: hypothetical protein F6J93_01755 [Oscillatoria sp. SIO1A7]|nr:hypothetical protein [Oscillatoria sp. SIO1A7]
MDRTLKLGSMAVLLIGLQAIALGIPPARAEVERQPQFQSASQWPAISRIIFNKEEEPDVDAEDPKTDAAGGRYVDF